MSKNVKRPVVSIVYRALNEEKWFDQSIMALKSQKLHGLDLEIILVDSGSTDKTLQIAAQHNIAVTHIAKSDFSFGRSLNQGCHFSKGDYLVFISAHCIPSGEDWLQNLVQPLIDGTVDYTYGRQIGHDLSKFSERQLFRKYFPSESAIPQQGFFCNNANSAIVRTVWEDYEFDEHVTGLEDMVLAKQLVDAGRKIGYVAEAPVIHVHEETYAQVRRRYYREALTLRDILPDVHMSIGDFFRYVSASIKFDAKVAAKQGKLFKLLGPIIAFRTSQFWGAYKGHNEIKKLSRKQKESYYFPDPTKKKAAGGREIPPAITNRSVAE